MNLIQITVDACSMLSAIPAVQKFQMVGSACYHPEPKDVDFLVLVEGAPGFFGDIEDCDGAKFLFGSGWETCSGEYDDMDDKWGALRKGYVNLIVTIDPAWYERAKLANEVCCALKLMDKGDRIVAYRVIRDGYSAEVANQRRDGSK
jgi:hypothetical protein